MSNPILVKRSAVPGKIPTTAQLPEGSIAMNTADKRMFFSASNNITLLANLSDLIWGNISGKPTTISGFGLTDAYTKLEVDAALLAKVSTALIGANSGVASLDSTGKIPSSQLPALAITDTYVVASQAAMLALTAAEVGDICVRTDLNKSFILKTTGYSVLANWQELLTPTDTVTSVNGSTGAVTISTITGNAGTATTLQTARTIGHSGDVTGSASFNGSANITIAMTLAAAGTAGTYTKVTTDSKGRVTSGTTLAATDIPALDWSKISTGKPTTVTGYGIVLTAGDIPNLDWAKITTGKPTTLTGYGITDAVASSLLGTASGVATLDATGKVPSSQLPSFVDDVLEGANLAAFPVTGESGKMYVALDTNKVYRWSGSAYIEISGSPGSTDAVVEGVTNLYFTAARAIAAVTSVSGNAGTATKLATARNIAMTGDVTWNVTFDGSGDVTATGTLTNVVAAGTSPKVTYNAKGLVTGGAALVAADIPALDWSKITTGLPTTLSGYGITDADLVAGQLRRTTTQALTTTAVDITFDTIDFANNTNVIARGAVTSQLIAKVAGVYEITFECETINTTNANLDVYQIKKNGVPVPQGLATVNPRSTRLKLSETVVLTLAANDYITVAASSNTGTTGTMQIGASLLMVRMQGAAGQDGAQGIQGPAGAPGGQSSVYYSAANLDNPSNANWAVNALAPATADTASAGLTVRAFDDTAEEGVGMTIYVPPGMTNVILTMTGKCATAPATAKAVIPKLYARSINIGAAVGAWNAGTVMTALNIPINNFYQSYQQTFTVASLGLTAGNSGQLELTRVGSNVGDTLVGDFHLLNLTVSFS